MNSLTTFFIDLSQPVGPTELLSAASYVSGRSGSGDTLACFAGSSCQLVDLASFVKDPILTVSALPFRGERRPSVLPDGVYPKHTVRVLITATCVPASLQEAFHQTVWVP